MAHPFALFAKGWEFNSLFLTQFGQPNKAPADLRHALTLYHPGGCQFDPPALHLKPRSTSLLGKRGIYVL